MLVRYIDIDNDVVILADNTDAEICAEIQAVAADSGELDDDTAVDSSRADISTVSFSDVVQSSRTLTHAATANGRCAHVGHEGSAALMVHGGCALRTLRRRTVY